MNEINEIEEFLSEWPSEESLFSPIINNIKHDRYEDGHVKFLFCDSEEEQLYWKRQIGKYLHLYVFSLLKEWGENNNSSIIRKRCMSFWKFYKDSIQSENYNFLLEIGSVPISIHTRIGFLMDSHLWIDNLYAPYLSVLTNKSMHLFTNDLYLKYSLLFEKYLKTISADFVDSKIKNLIDFCNSTDIIICKGKCFSLIVNKLGGEEHGGVVNALKSISYNRCSLETFKTIICYYFQNYTIYREKSYISFCNESKAWCFWKENAVSYSSALLYFILKCWAHDNNALELNHWLGILSGEEHVTELETEMKKLKEKINSHYNDIPKTIVEEIGFMIEEYFWERYHEIPSLLKSIVFSSDYADKYQMLLLDDVKYKLKNNLQVLIDKIDSYLQFCLILDSNATFKRTNFLRVLELTCDSESENIENILELYPYYGDDFGLSLLGFCQQNRLKYKLSKQAISRYKHHLFVDSWMSAIQERLEKNEKPYNIELCERTYWHMRIIEYIESRHDIFWSKCECSATQVINNVWKEDPWDKREPVRNNIIFKTKELAQKEKEIIYNNIKPFLLRTLKEGINFFIYETKELEEEKGKKTELTEKVHKVIYKILVEKYANKPLPSFSFDTTRIFYYYADKVARVWVSWEGPFSDVIKRSIGDAERESIKETFDSDAWSTIKNDVLTWCRSYYSEGVYSCSSTDSMADDNSDYNFDDDDLKGSERVG